MLTFLYYKNDTVLTWFSKAVCFCHECFSLKARRWLLSVFKVIKVEDLLIYIFFHPIWLKATVVISCVLWAWEVWLPYFSVNVWLDLHTPVRMFKPLNKYILSFPEGETWQSGRCSDVTRRGSLCNEPYHVVLFRRKSLPLNLGLLPCEYMHCRRPVHWPTALSVPASINKAGEFLTNDHECDQYGVFACFLYLAFGAKPKYAMIQYSWRDNGL